MTRVNAGAPTSATAPPLPLEIYVRIDAPNECHLYARGFTPLFFVYVFSPEILPLDMLVYRIPPELLRPDLWEPSSKDVENAIRREYGGLIVRAQAEWTELWRSDRAESGRILRDGLDAPAELLKGYILRTTGAGMLSLARAWGGRGRFDWVGLHGLPKDVPEEVLEALHDDLTHMRISIPEETVIFAAEGDAARVVFTRRADLIRAIRALLCGFASDLAGSPPAAPSLEFCENLARLADGTKFTSSPERDFVDKGRTFEITLHLDRTTRTGAGRRRWGPDRALIYYDRTSGLWAVLP